MIGRNAACRECGGNEAGDHGQHRLPIGLAMVSVERASHARDDGRRSELVTTVTTSVGRSDAGSCSHDGIDVRHGVAVLVANGDGADAGPAHGMRGSSRGGEVRHGRDGRTRGRATVIAADDAGRSRRRAVRFRAGLMEGAAVAMLLQGERPPTVRSTEADARSGPRRGGAAVRARAAQARMRRAAMRGGGHGEKMWRRPSPKRGPPPTGEASVAVTRT